MKSNLEIDEMFDEKFYKDGDYIEEPREDVKSFIHLLRENDRKAVLEWAEKNRKDVYDGGFADDADGDFIRVSELCAFLSSNHKER